MWFMLLQATSAHIRDGWCLPVKIILFPVPTTPSGALEDTRYLSALLLALHLQTAVSPILPLFTPALGTSAAVLAGYFSNSPDRTYYQAGSFAEYWAHIMTYDCPGGGGGGDLGTHQDSMGCLYSLSISKGAPHRRGTGATSHTWFRNTFFKVRRLCPSRFTGLPISCHLNISLRCTHM